jgi:outer membrane protein assembly factor BamB
MRLDTLFVVYLVSTVAAIGSPFTISVIDKEWRHTMHVNSEAALELAPELHPGLPQPSQQIPVCAEPLVAKDYYYEGGDFAVGTDPSTCGVFLSDFKVLRTTVGEDGTLYLEGKSDGQNSLRVYTRSGELKWAVPIDEIDNLLAVARDGTVYLMTTLRLSSVLTAYNPDGRVRWVVTNDGEQFGGWVPPAVGPDGTIYIFSGVQPGTLPDCRRLCPALLAITPQGQERWHVPIPRRPKDIVVDGDGRVLVNVPSGNLIAFDPQGHQLWSFTSEDKFGTGGIAVAADGTTYFASRFLYALDPRGKKKWVFKPETSYTEGEDFQVDPAIAEDGTVYAFSRHHELFAITPGGRKKWVVSDLPPGLEGVALSRQGILRTPSAWFSVSSGLASHGWPSANRDARNSRSQEAP